MPMPQMPVPRVPVPQMPVPQMPVHVPQMPVHVPQMPIPRMPVPQARWEARLPSELPWLPQGKGILLVLFFNQIQIRFCTANGSASSKP